MSRIDDLIRDLCPDGVEYKSLGEVGRLLGGLTGKTKADFVDGTARYVSYKNVYSNLEVNVTAGDFVKISDSETQNTLQIGDILFTGSSENREEVGLTSVVTSLPLESLYLNSFCICFRPNKNFTLLPEFAKHLFRSGTIRQQVIKTATGVTRINISRKNLAKIQVPLPPAEVQQEVARTLDQFTQLEAELEAELEARRKQYAHHRLLLIAEAAKDAPLVRLHDLGTWHGGITPSKKRADFWNSPDIHWLTPKDMSSDTIVSTIDHISHQALVETTLKHLSENCVAFVFRSNILRRKLPIAIVRPRVTLNQDMRALVTRDDVSANYVAEVCLAQQDFLRSRFVRTDGSMAAVESKALFNHKIPVPPLRKQEQIADQLAAFRSASTDLTSSLSAEIEARRKQYEYYRDRLLAFSEKK